MTYCNESIQFEVPHVQSHQLQDTLSAHNESHHKTLKGGHGASLRLTYDQQVMHDGSQVTKNSRAGNTESQDRREQPTSQLTGEHLLPRLD